jgi:mono/diheme cytochrome c family protein
MRLSWPVPAAFWLAALPAIVCDAMAAGDVAKGHDLATAHCARCHVVSDKNRFTGISSTPSFMLLVNALADWEERFETFYARRPHPVHVRVKGHKPLTELPPNAAPFEIELSDVEDILAYARTLIK